MIRIICINGAPGVGKDTAGKLLKEIYGDVKLMKFALPSDEIAQNLLDISDSVYADWRENRKDEIPTKHNSACKVTLAELLITISENFIKPCFGETYLAHECAAEIGSAGIGVKNEPVYVITDVGFQYEFEYFKECFKDTANVRLINIKRDGYTFDDDPREEVYDIDNALPAYNNHTINIHNDGTIEELKQLLSVDFFS